MIGRLEWILLLAITIKCAMSSDSDLNAAKAGMYLEKALGAYDVKNIINDVSSAVMAHATCGGCKAGFAFILLAIKIKNENEVKKIIATVCILLKLQTPEVCIGIARVFSPTITTILKNTNSSPEDICVFILGDTCGDSFNQNNNWKVAATTTPKPSVQLLQPPSASNPKLKVLQLTDIHIDPYYMEGSNANCREPLCCRNTSGNVAKPEDMAGKWGDYFYCDTPPILFENLLNHIKTQHPDIDYIMWTGDVPPHDPWMQTKEHAVEIIGTIANQIGDAFPNIPVYPVIGNHEAVPINNFVAPAKPVNGFNMSWLYDELDIIWRRWLPTTTSQTIRYGAYYSLKIKSDFKIISLNSNFCYNYNWWMLVYNEDPGEELQWLIKELQDSEDNNEKVHILSHIPPGSTECLKVWSRNYNEIIERYENTVMAQFFGHTHYDEFEVQYDVATSGRPINMAYIAPSVSPYNDLNPGYRIYYVDGDYVATTRQIIDYETWIMNLTDANAFDNPVWYKSYSAKSLYNMTALRPQDWDFLISQMVNDENVFNLYYKNYWKWSDTMPTCDDNCKKERICDTKSGRSHERKAMCGDIYNTIRTNTRRNWADNIFGDISKVITFLTGWMKPDSYI